MNNTFHARNSWCANAWVGAGGWGCDNNVEENFVLDAYVNGGIQDNNIKEDFINGGIWNKSCGDGRLKILNACSEEDKHHDKCNASVVSAPSPGYYQPCEFKKDKCRVKTSQGVCDPNIMHDNDIGADPSTLPTISLRDQSGAESCYGTIHFDNKNCKDAYPGGVVEFRIRQFRQHTGI